MKKQKIKLDIPYNFDKGLVPILKILERDLPEIEYCSIYLPAMVKDEFSVLRSHQDEDPRFNFSDEEYISHIKLIDSYFPGKILLLMQQKNYIMPDDRILFYHSLGINKFCVNGLEKAKTIRRLIPNAEIWCSLTAKLMPEDIIKNKDLYKPYFDGIILFWYPYNKNINLIKMLPKDFKYLILANAGCSQKCGGEIHWFKTDLTSFTCPFKNPTQEENSFIPPNDIWFFLPYVYGLKLQDRGFSTGQIITYISAYAKNNDLLEFDRSRVKKYLLNTYQVKL